MKQEIQQPPHICPDCGDSFNRKHRRSMRWGPSTPTAARRLIEANDELKTVVGPCNSATYKAIRRSYASIVYAGNEDPLLNYSVISRKLSVALNQARKLPVDSELIEGVSAVEMYSRPVRGTSLFDIERMTLPLSEENIRKISRTMRYHPWIARVGNFERVAISAALILPSQVLARSQFLDKAKDRPCPPSLKNLHERMMAYLDYYAYFLTNPNVSTEQMINYTFSASWIGGHMFQTLGLYIPARLGLTPSSSIKMFEAKTEQLPFGIKKKVFNYLVREVRDAFRPDALPDHLNKYQHYDRETDQQAAGQLLHYYSNTVMTPAESDLEQLFSRLGLYRKRLLSDIKASKKELRIPLPEHPAIGEVLVTSQYPQTLMFILFMRKDNSHVTLEVNGSDRMYGVPVNLTREYPHIADVIAVDIISKILKEAKQRHPDVEPRLSLKVVSAPKVVPTATAKPSPKVLPPDVLEADLDEIKEELKGERKKRKMLGMASLVPQFAPQPELPKPIERLTRFKVHHTRTEIAEQLGKVPKQDVDRIIEAVAKFEYGDKKVSPLREDNNLFRLRVGDYRVVLRILEDGTFSVDRVGNRREIYDFYSH